MSQPVSNPPGRSWKMRLFVCAGVLLVLVWAAPIIAAYTPVLGWVAGKASEAIDGRVEIGGASLGWFSPIVLYDVTVRDADNEVIAQIPKIEGDRALLKLALDQSDLGTFRIERAKIDWTFRGNDSNIERLLAKALKPSPESKSPSSAATTIPHFDVEIVDSTLKIDDADTKQTWQIRGLAVDVRMREESESIRINVLGSLHDGNEPGSLKVELHVKDWVKPDLQANAKGTFSSVPMAMANVIARRYQRGFAASGSLQGYFTLGASMKAGEPQVEAVGEVIAGQVIVDSPHLADPLRIDRISVPYAVRLDGAKLSSDRLEVRSDFGKATLRGTLDLGQDLLAMLDQPGFDFTVDVNLATLAERLPKTLKLHSDLRMTAGNLHVKCTSVAKDGKLVWEGRVHTSDIRGIKGKQTIAWSDPITLDFQVRNLRDGMPMIDQLRCTSRFLNMEARTTAEQFTLAADADLAQLAEPLGQFVDLDAVKLAGRARGAVVARKLGKDRFMLGGDLNVQDLHVTWLTKHPWQEPSLTARFDALSQIDAKSKQRLEAGKVEVNLGKDQVALQLTEPIADLAAVPLGAATIRLDGDLSRWKQRAQSWTPLLDAWQLGGVAKVRANVKVSPDSIAWSTATLDASEFICIGPSVWIREPTVSAHAAGKWLGMAKDLELTHVKLSCPTVQLESDRLTLHPTTLATRGVAAVKGDLARLKQWTQDPKAKPGEPIAGTFAGKVDLASSNSIIGGAFDVAITNATYGPAANPIWREPDVKCVGKAGYDLARDRLMVEKLHLGATTLTADGKGTINNLTTTCELDLAGTLAYDLEKLTPKLQPMLGKDVKIAGKDARPFKLAGPLYPKTGPAAQMHFTELKGEAGLEWKSLKAYGCDVGKADVRAILQKGWFQLYPIETSINGGKLRLQPNLRLEPEPMEMVLLAGPIVEKAQITPAMCSSAMGYALPILANVAEAEGSVSLALDGGRIPISTPTTGDVKGTFIIHSAKIGPGPLVKQLSLIFKVPPPTSTIKECKVPFHMVAGKVHHRDLELAFPEFTLKSSGAVGLDGSLALVIETPVPPHLARAAKLTPTQAKQLVRIPVGGTMDQPRPDPRALESLTSIIGRSILENELNKLLQPKR